MQGLKFLVIAMGALIVIGLTLLVYGVYHQANGPTAAPASATAETAPHPNSEPLAPFGDVNITLPEGCHIAAVRPTKGRRLFLHIGPSAPPCESVIVFDLAKGVVLGTLRVKSGP